MVATLEATIDEAAVAEAVSDAYVARAVRVVEPPLVDLVHSSLSGDVAGVRTVVAVEDRIVELVVDEGPFEALGPAVSALAARGWEVVVLVAGRRNGEAHRALRGNPCRLQLWWVEDAVVRFGRHEVP